jgi:hypothetical protein
MIPRTRLAEILTAQSISAATFYALAAHLLAAQVDLAAGSDWCATMNVAVAVAQHLLIDSRSDGRAPSYLATHDTSDASERFGDCFSTQRTRASQ